MANYAGTIVAHALAESRENHTPSIKLQIQVHTDLDSRKPVDALYYADLWLTDKAVDKTMATLRALGYNEDTLEPLNDANRMIMRGFPVEIKTRPEEYNGRVYDKVEYVNAPGSFASRGVSSCDDATARRIASRYDSVLRNSPKGVATAPQAPRPVRSTGPAQVPPPQASDYLEPAGPDDGLPW